ncbi:MAG: AAA family ATPase [Paludibacteraceae bacterium]|nr:AAA family ATPase [Paludibacteraceae bacterium]
MNKEVDLFEPLEDEHQQLGLPASLEEPWEETEQSTLLDAFIYLTRDTDVKGRLRPQRTMNLDTSDNEAVRYLMRRLDMTKTQIQLLACIVFQHQGFGRTCDMDDLTQYMSSHPLELYTKQGDFDVLVERGYVEADESRLGGTEWTIRKEAMVALSKNIPFDVQSLRAEDAASFLAQCCSAIREGRQHDEDGSIEKEINWLFELNKDLPIVINIKRLSADDKLVFKPLVLAASLMSAEAAISFAISEFNMILNTHDVRKVGRAMQKGNHPLVMKKVFEPMCSSGGMADADQWVISKDGWMELLSQNMEEVNNVLNDNEDWGRNLTPYTNIPERKLYFSGKTKEEVNRLRLLLQDEQYQQVVARLKEKNMPTGLNVLLYGAPGTGKTELVQQLARETGRDIFIVDMSQIRDKYVGESEHNLSRIFSTYRTYVARLRKTPILFCNECDAIFGSRMERTSHSVDKMENALQNILLEQMEKMQGIMICTTNLTSALDNAFERRFLLKVQLPKPNNEARKQIWATMLPKLSDEQTTVLANRFDFSGGQIQNVTRKQVINSIFSGTDEMDFNRLIEDCTAETMDRSNGRQIGFR